LAALVMLALIVAMHVHGSARHSAWQDCVDERRSAVARVGFSDLALSSSARWLRAPSQTERSAPLSDGPIAFDTDPAGALLGPVEEAP
ncbi:MAG: hypothetical protein AAF411_26105, partial [Myxococcota bacterium]